MRKMKQLFRGHFADQSGISLLSTMMMVIILSMFLLGGIAMYKSWRSYSLVADTGKDIDQIEQALRQFVTENGYYPCPASLTAPVDSADATNRFGVSVNTNCPAAPSGTQTFQTTGRDGRKVRTGAVPVRTLGLPDEYAFDPYHKRYIYAVTEVYAVQGSSVNGDMGAIEIEDGNGNNATSVVGNIVHVVYSMGYDNNGAYSVSGGSPIAACDTSKPSGENCDFSSNAKFKNTVAKSYNDRALFTTKVSYSTAMTPTCTSSGVSPFKDVAFLLDTSKSMEENPGAQFCPVGMEGCSRMDLARWALRRVLPSRIYNNQDMEGAGKTLFTGFVNDTNGTSDDAIAAVDRDMGNPTFNDPTSPNYTHPTEDAVNSALESKLETMCPENYTPLGNHIEVLANKLGSNDTPAQPNKIIVISDGESNRGKDPLAVARAMKAKYPNLQIDIIDLVGNDSMKQVAAATGGKYFQTTNPTDLIQQFEASLQMCKAHTPQKAPVDKRGCGSKGNWGK